MRDQHPIISEAADILGCLASQPEFFEGGRDWTWQLYADGTNWRRTDPHVPGPLPIAMSDAAYELARAQIEVVMDDDPNCELTWRETYSEAEAGLRALRPRRRA